MTHSDNSLGLSSFPKPVFIPILLLVLALVLAACPQMTAQAASPNSSSGSFSSSSESTGTISGAPITLLGYAAATVLSGSMEPEIPKGSLVVVKSVDANELAIGDDIMFMTAPSTSFTHRIVGIEENWQNTGKRAFKTQGVHNSNPDNELVAADNVVGKVVFTNYPIGVCVTFLQQNWPLIVFLIVVLIALRYALKRINRPRTPAVVDTAQAAEKEKVPVAPQGVQAARRPVSQLAPQARASKQVRVASQAGSTQFTGNFNPQRPMSAQHAHQDASRTDASAPVGGIQRVNQQASFIPGASNRQQVFMRGQAEMANGNCQPAVTSVARGVCQSADAAAVNTVLPNRASSVEVSRASANPYANVPISTRVPIYGFVDAQKAQQEQKKQETVIPHIYVPPEFFESDES